MEITFSESLKAISGTTKWLIIGIDPKISKLKKPTLHSFISYKIPLWMSFRIVYICEQLLSLYVIVSRSFGVLYKSPSCSCFTGLHPNQSKLHSLKMLNLL